MSAAPDRAQPHVVAVVLTWKDTEMTMRCVRSLLATDYPGLEIVVVDNGSESPCLPAIQSEFPSVVGVQLDHNQGFTGGCNRGIEKALDMGADYVFLLNNDTIVGEEAIVRLCEAMEARPDAAMASALLLLPGDDRIVQFFRGEIQRNCARHIHPGENVPISDDHRRTIETEFAPACAVLLRPEALQEVGLFDEALFTNWEDYDFCCRLHEAGWKLLTVGAAEVVHAHGQTTGKISPFITYFFTRNRLICLFRYGTFGGILKCAPFYARTLYWQVKDYGFTNWPAHRAFLKGIFDFVCGKRGVAGAPTDRRDRRRG